MFDFALTFQKAYCIRSAWKFIFFDIFRIVSTFENFKSIKISFVSTFGIYIVDKNIASVYFWKLNLKNNIFRVHFIDWFNSTCLRIKTNNLWMVFLKGSPYPIGTVNLLFCVGERRYAFGPEIHSVSQTADRPRSAGRFYLRQPPAAGYEALSG